MQSIIMIFCVYLMYRVIVSLYLICEAVQMQNYMSRDIYDLIYRYSSYREWQCKLNQVHTEYHTIWIYSDDPTVRNTRVRVHRLSPEAEQNPFYLTQQKTGSIKQTHHIFGHVRSVY